MTPQPFHVGYLPKQNGHKVWYAEYGNPKGIPIIVCHGGPGSKSRATYTSNYDLDKYHVIIFDQRGCGNSLPLGEINHNTIQDLVVDMERLRTKLIIGQWYVAGSSWGSTLALVYAQSHPGNVLGLLLSSIFLARSTDEKWSFSKDGGITRMFPDLSTSRFEFSPAEILHKINIGSPEVAKELVASVMNWEGNLMSSQSDLEFASPADITEENIASVKIFLHYEANNYLLFDNQILNNLSQINHIPTIIVHGRYDLLCPLDNAYLLHKNLPQSELIILPNSNHHFTADGAVARRMAFKYFLEKYDPRSSTSNS